MPRHLARKALSQVRCRAGVRPVAHRKIVYRQLCCWDYALQKPPGPGEVAGDPQRGRFVFPPGGETTGRVTVNYPFSLAGGGGARPVLSDPFPPPTPAVVPPH